MNGFENTRKKDAQASKNRLLQELEKLTARKKSIERQLQQLRAKKAEPPAALQVKENIVAPEASFGLKRPAPAVAAAEPKRQRLGPSKDKRASGQSVWRICQSIVNKLKKHNKAGWFVAPVDPKHVPDYYDVVKQPMDLGTVAQRLEKGVYKTPLEFRDDMRLIWNNCRIYNKVGSDAGKAGEQLSNKFEQEWATSKVQLLWEEEMNGPAQDAVPAPAAGFVATKQAPDTMRQLDVEMRERLQNSRGRPDGDSSQELTFEDKRKLSIKLGELPGDRLCRVLEIVEEDVKLAATDSDGEIELDIDQLSTSTLRKLWDYVTTGSIKDKPAKPGRAGQQSEGPVDHGQDRHHNNEPSSQVREIKAEQTRSQAEGQASPSSSSAGSGGSSSSDSGSRGASQEKVASTWGDGNDYTRQQPSVAGGDGNGAATVDVSTTKKAEHNILKPNSHKKDLSLKNASQWAAAATTKVQANGRSSDKRDELWDQFVSLDEKQLAKRKEEMEQQERERHEKEQREERERQVKVEQQAAEEAKKRDLAVQKEKELERLQGMAGTAKLTNQTDYELADMPKNELDMNKVLGLRPIEADDDEY